jgi:hypothetical protein
MLWLAWLVRLTIAPVFIAVRVLLAQSPPSVKNLEACFVASVIAIVN